MESREEESVAPPNSAQDITAGESSSLTPEKTEKTEKKDDCAELERLAVADEETARVEEGNGKTQGGKAAIAREAMVTVENVTVDLATPKGQTPATGGRRSGAVSGVRNNNVETASFKMSGLPGRKNVESDNKNVPSFMEKFETILGHVNQYVLFEEIGRGMQGTVYKCMNQDDKKMYAIKRLDGASLGKRRHPGKSSTSLMNEIQVMTKVAHPNLVKLYEVIDDPKEDRLYLVMDYVTGRSVMGDKDVMNAPDPLAIAIPEQEAKRLFFDFVLGMEELHRSGILHRDIKPSNMLIDENTEDDIPRCKVCDFGVSTICSNVKSAKILGEDDLIYVGLQGTIAMMSPEALGAGPDNIYHGRPADVWAAGVTLYCMLTGTLPFKEKDIDALRESIFSAHVTFPSKPKISKDAKALIKRMLAKDQSLRPTFSGIRQDVWFNSLDIRRQDSTDSIGGSSQHSSGGSRSDPVSTDDSSSLSRSGKARSRSSGKNSISWITNFLDIFNRKSHDEAEDDDTVVVGGVTRVTHNQHIGVRGDGSMKHFGLGNRNGNEIRDHAASIFSSDRALPGTDGDSNPPSDAITTPRANPHSLDSAHE